MLRSRIIGTGSSVPAKVLCNKDFESFVDTTDEWIITRTGIRERHIAENGDCTSTFSYRAALSALEMAGIAADALDLIIVGTISPDMPMPSVACFVQHMLKANRAAAFDLSAGCTGFLYAMSVADAFIRSGMYKKILVIGAETLSKFTDYQDRTTCVLFGDGAGAVVLAAEQGDRGILSTSLYADGAYADLLLIPGGGSLSPVSQESMENRQHYIKMDGNKVFKVAVKSLEEAALAALAQNNLTGKDIDLLVSHQANVRIIDAIAKRLKLPPEKVFMNIERYGNTSAASIPIALDEANRQHRIKKNDLILLDAFGAGLTWGSALIRW
ncbi:MAG: ketoacyl-ACP synthase III [Deltaproteobacteria bacterium]|nr:ketoacyl-ACP synthase III [Deltaproteobacteria bacterium]